MTHPEIFAALAILGVWACAFGVWGIYHVVKNAANEHLKAMQALYDVLQKKA